MVDTNCSSLHGKFKNKLPICKTSSENPPLFNCIKLVHNAGVICSVYGLFFEKFWR